MLIPFPTSNFVLRYTDAEAVSVCANNLISIEVSHALDRHVKRN